MKKKMQIDSECMSIAEQERGDGSNRRTFANVYRMDREGVGFFFIRFLFTRGREERIYVGGREMVRMES